MGHTHTLPTGTATVAGCGCVILADPAGTIQGTVDKCSAHGGKGSPGDCRACETGRFARANLGES